MLRILEISSAMPASPWSRSTDGRAPARRRTMWDGMLSHHSQTYQSAKPPESSRGPQSDDKSGGQSGEKGPAARRRPKSAREAYSLYVPLGGGLRPPSETSPQDSLRRQSRRSKAEHFHVGRRATNEDSHGPALNGPVRARASPAQPIPGGGFGGGRRGPLRWNEADGPLSSLWLRRRVAAVEEHGLARHEV